MIKDFHTQKKYLKNIKNCQFSFFDILQLPHIVMSNSEKLTILKIRAIFLVFCFFTIKRKYPF